MKFEIQGIMYDLRMPTFGQDLDALEGAFEFKMKQGANGGDPEADVSIKGGEMNAVSVLKCMKDWTFKGFNSDTGELVTEGEILPITLGSIKQLPASHGNHLIIAARRLTQISDADIKNL